MAPRRSQSSTAQARAEKAKGKKPIQEGNPKGTDPPREEQENAEEQAPSLSAREIARMNHRNEIRTYKEITETLMATNFKGTRFPDMEVLKELGIHDEVQEIFKNMGLHKLFNMSNGSYLVPTCQFLASLEVTFYEVGEEGDPAFGDGFIKFMIGRTIHHMGFNKLNEIFGFARGRVRGTSFEFEDRELSRLWSTIAAGSWKAGKAKASWIRHPAIRYAHRFLSQTFFAKKESGYVAEDELELLDIGLTPILANLGMRGQFKGTKKKVGVLVILLKHLLHYKPWILSTKDKKPKLSIGGLIAPILEATADNLGPITHESEDMGVSALNKINFLVGKAGNSYAYKFQVNLKVGAHILLPCPHLTSFSDRSNIQFNPPKEMIFDPLQGPPLASLAKRVNKTWQKEGAPDSVYEEGEGATSSPKYGSARYYFEEDAEASPQVALKQARQHVKLLQRWNKWQDKTIKSLVKTVKSMKGQIKELKAMVGGSSSSRGRAQAEQQDEVVDSAVDTDLRRHSFHEIPREMPQAEPSRQSSHERRQRRKRRATHTPSPQSSNMSYSMDTSYSSSSIQF